MARPPRADEASTRHVGFRLTDEEIKHLDELVMDHEFSDRSALLRAWLEQGGAPATTPQTNLWKSALHLRVWSAEGPKGNTARSVLTVLLWNSDEHGRTLLGIPAIMFKAGIGNERTVRKALEVLTNGGWLKVTPQTWSSLAVEQSAMGRPVPSRGDIGQAPNLYTVLADSSQMTTSETSSEATLSPVGKPPRTNHRQTASTKAKAKLRSNPIAKVQIEPMPVRKRHPRINPTPRTMDSSPSPTTQPKSIMRELLAELNRHRGALLIRVADVVRALLPHADMTTVHEAILMLNRNGLIELRPDGGSEFLKPEDAAICPRGPRETVFSYARFMDDSAR